jgi:hypothetical protein
MAREAMTTSGPEELARDILDHIIDRYDTRENDLAYLVDKIRTTRQAALREAAEVARAVPTEDARWFRECIAEAIERLAESKT